jgi:putative transposase
MEYKTNNNIVYSCKYHVVWCPKYRRKVLTGEIVLRLKQLVKEIVEEKHGQLLELEVMPDHTHLLVEVDPQYGIHRLVKIIKGRTSRLLRQEFRTLRQRLPSLWTNSYFVSTVGGAPLAIIKQYIENQKHV